MWVYLPLLSLFLEAAHSLLLPPKVFNEHIPGAFAIQKSGNMQTAFARNVVVDSIDSKDRPRTRVPVVLGVMSK